MAVPNTKPVEQAAVLSPANDPSSEAEKHERLATDDALAEFGDDEPCDCVDVETCDLTWLDDQVTFHLFSSKSDTDTSNPLTFPYRELLRETFGKHRGQNDKNGPAVIGATFIPYTGQINPKDKNSKPYSSGRVDDLVSSMTFLQLDFDNKSPKGRPVTFIDIVVWLESRGYAGYIYTTFSHSSGLTKFRVVLFLKTPFKIRDSLDDPNGGLREALYRRGYAFIASTTGEPWDTTCENPSRLFFCPAFNVNEDGAEARCHRQFIPGNQIDFDAIVANLPPEPVKEKKPRKSAGVSADRKKFDEAWKGIRQHFDAARFASDHDETAKGDEQGKVQTFCPFDDEHGTPDGEGSGKTPVLWLNADNAQHETATVSCRHETCSKTLKRTAGEFVFAVMDREGLTLDDLREYIADDDVREGYVGDPDTFLKAVEDDVEAVTKASKAGPVEALVLRIVRCPKHKHPGLLRTLKENSGWRQKDIDALAAAARAEVAAATSDATNFVASPDQDIPDDPAKAGIIYSTWDFHEQVRMVLGRFAAKNNEDPNVYAREEGGYVRLTWRGNKARLDEIYKVNQWMVEVSERMKFIKITPDDATHVKPFDNVMAYFDGSNTLELPLIERIVNVPVFGADGSLRTEKGYHEASQSYLNPNIEFRAVPDDVTEDDVAEALYWLHEAVRDFPFSDSFTGRDPLPVRDGSVDDDGFALPTYERGKSSRANYFALMLQPFARAFIDGPCPAYLLDKSMPGTGAGFLADVAGYTLYGHRMTPQTVSEDKEEFRKEITATLREGAATIFLDNINHKMDHGPLASALTSGNWKGRLLGQSTNIDVPVRATWIFAANSGKFSEELMRRIVPIRMDAATPNPSRDRPIGWYKNPDLHGWLDNHREDLVWSCHVLIKNWLQAGAPNGTQMLQSFNSWARTMGGILEAAGVEGFLENVPDYLKNRADDSNDKTGFFARLLQYVKIGDDFDVEVAALAAVSKHNPEKVDPMLGINQRHGQSINQTVGYFLRGQVGKTFLVGSQKLAVTKVDKPAGGNAVYRLEEVAG